MKRMLRIACLLLAFMVVSCEHKDLCYLHPHQTMLRILVDWSKFNVELPTGMSVYVFPKGDGDSQLRESNTLTHVDVSLKAGLYDVLVFNQSPSEFGTITFSNLGDYDNMSVCCNPHTSRWYSRSDGEKVAKEPEWFGVDLKQSVEVTTRQLEEIGAAMARGEEDTEGLSVIARMTPLNVIYTVHVRIHVEGIHNLRSFRGSLSGMADGRCFSEQQPSCNEVTHLMETWEKHVDDNDPTKGYLEATFRSFGLPGNHQGNFDENLLTISALLVDNETILDFPIQVGDKIEEDHEAMQLYIDIDNGIVLPDVEADGGGDSGFNATVDDWGDEIEQEIII